MAGSALAEAEASEWTSALAIASWSRLECRARVERAAAAASWREISLEASIRTRWMSAPALRITSAALGSHVWRGQMHAHGEVTGDGGEIAHLPRSARMWRGH